MAKTYDKTATFSFSCTCMCVSLTLIPDGKTPTYAQRKKKILIRTAGKKSAEGSNTRIFLHDLRENVVLTLKLSMLEAGGKSLSFEKKTKQNKITKKTLI